MTTLAPRWIRLAALAACLALPFPALAAEVVRMGDLPAITNAGLYIAIEKGFFQARGITVETERFASAGKMVAPLATGQLDVAVGAPSAGLYNAIAGGMDFRIVADKGQLRPGGSFVYEFTPPADACASDEDGDYLTYIIAAIASHGVLSEIFPFINILSNKIRFPFFH